jgi:hypothetical protein
MEKVAAYPNASEYGFGEAQTEKKRLRYNSETGRLE